MSGSEPRLNPTQIEFKTIMYFQIRHNETHSTQIKPRLNPTQTEFEPNETKEVKTAKISETLSTLDLH